MSLRKFVSQNDESRHHHDEDAANLARTLSYNGGRPPQADAPITLPDSKQAPAPERPVSPLPERRRIVIPDPVAFR